MACRDEGQTRVLEAVLTRLAAELADLAARSRALEVRMEAQPAHAIGIDLQDLDFLTQHLEATSTVLDALSAATRNGHTLDDAWLARISGTLRLQGLAGRLTGQEPREVALPSGEMELW